MEALLFVLFALAAVGAVFGAYWLKQQRRKSLASFAHRFGLQFSPQDPFDLLRHDFTLLRKGDGRGCENVLWGEWHGLPMRAADYWYYTESTDSNGNRSRSYRRFQIAVVELPAFLPRVSVEKENLFTRAADGLGFRDLEFESDRFNRLFQVTSRDRQFAYRLIDPRMMRWLLSTEGRFGLEVWGQHLLVYCGRRKPDALVPLFGTARGFYDHVPRLVWSEYALTSGAGPDRSEGSTR